MPGMSVGAYNPYVYSPNVGLGQPTPALDAGTGLAGTSLYKPPQPPGYPGGGGGFDLGGNGSPMQMIVQMLQLMMMMFQMFMGGGGLPLPLGNSGTAGGNAGTAGTGLAGTGLAGTGLAGTGLAGTAGTGVAGTNFGIAGTNNGVAGTNFGIAGTNNGVAGTNFGIAGTNNGVAGTNVGGGGTNVGGGGNNGVAGTNTGVAGSVNYGTYTPPPAQDNTPVYTPPVYTPPPAQDNTPVYTPPVYTPPPAKDTEPPVVTYPPVDPPPAKDTQPPMPPYCPPVEPPPAKDTEPPVYPPPPVEPPPPVYPPPPPPPDYKDNDKGNYWGDPHFVGFGGEKYDVMGTAGQTYNILSDKGLQYNAKFEQWGKGDATVIGEAGMLVGNDKVHFDRSGAAPTVNGVAMEVGKEVQLDNGSGSAVWDGTKLVVNTREYTIDLQVKDPNNANGAYIDSNVSIRSGVNPLADGVAAHGILGQTADGVAGAHVGNLGQDQGKQGGTVIDGTVADYVINGGIFSTNGANAQFIRYA